MGATPMTAKHKPQKRCEPDAESSEQPPASPEQMKSNEDLHFLCPSTKHKRKKKKKTKERSPEENEPEMPTSSTACDIEDHSGRIEDFSGAGDPSKKKKAERRRHKLEFIDDPKAGGATGTHEAPHPAESSTQDRRSKRRKQEPVSSSDNLSREDGATKPGMAQRGHGTSLSSPLGVDRTEALNGVSDLSQDLFLTQRQFLPARASSSSDMSPPLGQDWLRSQNRSSTVPSQPSGGALSDHRRTTSTQTDDAFTYLALAAFLRRRKAAQPCPEKPLDLSLPTRARAAGCDVIFVRSLSPSRGRPAAPKSRRKSRNPAATCEESKLVQSVLNSSYFFKGKGEHDERFPITPLVKVKQPPNPQRRKSILLQPPRNEL